MFTLYKFYVQISEKIKDFVQKFQKREIQKKVSQTVSVNMPGDIYNIENVISESLKPLINFGNKKSYTRNGTTIIGNITSNSGNIIIGNNIYSSNSGVIGNGHVKVFSMPVTDIFKIKSDNSYDIKVVKSTENKIEVTCEENIFPLFKITTNGIFTISSNSSYTTTKGISIVLYISTNLKEVSVSGSGDIEIDEVTGTSLLLKTNSSGNITLKKGHLDHIDILISGSGDVDCNFMSSNTSNIKISGSGDCTSPQNSSVTASLSGSGDLTLNKSKCISQRVTGSGDIN